VAGHDARFLDWVRIYLGASAAHVVGLMAKADVVMLYPALEAIVESFDAGEELPVEGDPVELVEHGALEAFAHCVVVPT